MQISTTQQTNGWETEVFGPDVTEFEIPYNSNDRHLSINITALGTNVDSVPSTMNAVIRIPGNYVRLYTKLKLTQIMFQARKKIGV